jgi:hypothetical protein
VGWWNVNPQGQDEGNFNVQANCPDGRSMDLELPTGNVWTFGGPVIDCDVQFHVPELLNAQCAAGNCPIGGLPDGSNYAPSVFYFFRADTTNKRGRLDDAYNVVWTDAVFSVLWQAADGTSCAWHVTGSIADLYKRPDILEQPTGQAVVLDVTIVRADGPCAI